MRKLLLRCLFALAALCAWPAWAGAKDRALLVGIDEYRHAKDIEGSVNDTELLRDFLMSRLGFEKGDIEILTNGEATEEAIRARVKRWLIEGTRPGDRVFFAYAGHGARVPDRSDDEDLDGMDEVLAAHDVVPQGPFAPGRPLIPADGYITDDEISRWIAALHGRQVVMFFDSCHSGTISRGMGSRPEHESRFLRFDVEDAARQKQDVYSPDYNRSPLSRDVGTATEGFLDKLVNGVVVISAASADQEAFPIDARKYGRKQGALTYVFVEKQRDKLIPVESLQHVLREGMDELKRDKLLIRGRNGQYQVPQVEIHLQQQAAAALPIFGGAAGGSWTAALAVAVYNPASQAKVEIKTADGRSAYSINKRLADGRTGEMIPLTISTDRPGHLYLWVFSRGGVAKCLFPWKRDPNNALPAGTYTFPRCVGGKESCEEEDKYEYAASPPEGQDVWVALVTDKPLELRDDDREYSWEEAFRRIGLPKVQAALSSYAEKATTTRGVDRRMSQRPTVTDWQAAVIVLTATR